MMAHRGKIALVFIVLAGLLAAAWWFKPRERAADVLVGCGDLAQACTINLNGKALVIQADHTPVALKPFRLKLLGAGDGASVRFGMVGMDMGPIAYPLKPQPDGSLGAGMMLPYCVQGRHDWWMRLTVAQGVAEVGFTSGK